MAISPQEQIERFHRRAERTDERTLMRNLEAGVYGPPGSARRSVAERALELKRAEQVEVFQAATAQERAELIAVARRAAAAATRAAWASLIAALFALLAAARSFGIL